MDRDLLTRPRLLALLRQRWQVRLCAVTAGPGFGKSVALAAAMDDAKDVADRHDHWLTCEPADEDADHLAHAVVEVLGCPPSTDAVQIARWVWSRAPAHECLLLDDVHLLGAATTGAGWLRDLVDAMPANGHVVTTSRRALPFPVHAWALRDELLRLDEDDLRFDEDELAAYAHDRSVAHSLLEGTGGWPALVALRAHAGADLIDKFLWDEVLGGLSPDRVRGLAQLQAVGGGDDELVGALTGGAHGVESLLDGVPLAERRAGGWAGLHGLWRPVLEGHLSAAAVDEAIATAITVHRRRGRTALALELAIGAARWDDVLVLLRDAVLQLPDTPPSALARWYRALPLEHRLDPAAWLVAGVEQGARQPRVAVASFEEAAAGFRRRGDHEAELVALSYLGLHAWWENDFGRILELVQRVDELHQDGVPGAEALHRIGRAGGAHLVGDPADVLAELSMVDDDQLGSWLRTAQWLRAVAHRRRGELGAAEAALQVLADAPDDRMGPQAEVARLRGAWLDGRVDEVLEGMARVVTHFDGTGDRHLGSEVRMELVAKRALVGRLDEAKAMFDATGPVDDLPGSLIRVLGLLARTTLAVGQGDDAAATTILREADEPALGQPWSWYWPDRAALALAYVLRPELRPAIDDLDLPPVLAVGVDLGRAVVAARAGDLEAVGELPWPAAGVVRAHVPLRWLTELVSAAEAAGNPAPADIVERVRPHPGPTIQISVLGPLRVHRDGVEVMAPELRRRRVRELLCSLVDEPRRRRAALAEELWPDVADPAANLRVNLSHLQRLLEPERARDAVPALLRADGTFLTLSSSPRLVVDVWELVADLDAAELADRSGDVEGALEAYLRAISRWHGEPFEDVGDAPWVHAAREALRRRHVAAALRAGELLLAAGDPAGARHAAERALDADPHSTAPHHLLVRAHVAEGDQSGARRAVAASESALAVLGLPPDPAVAALLR